MMKTARVPEIPNCNYCQKDGNATPAVYDCRTVYGHWAYLCEEHFTEYGPGRLGLGLGQKLVLMEVSP